MTPIPVTPSGSDDTQALQDAFSAACLPSSGYANGSVELSGVYKVSAPLIAGTSAARPPLFVIRDYAVIRYLGPQTSDYLIRYAGEGRLAAPRVQRLQLDCGGKCRGLLVTHQCYAAEFSHLYIRNAREIALDFVGCWCSWVHDCIVASCDGIGLRVTAHNSAAIERIKLGGKGELWPDPSDASVLDWKGRFVRTTPEDRACVVVAGTGQLTTANLTFEVCRYAGSPLINLMSSGYCRVRDPRIEQCEYSEPVRDIGSGNDVSNMVLA